MRRRSFLAGVAALAAMRHAGAQPRSGVPRVGAMFAQRIPNAFYEAFRRGLLELGYIEGKNIQVDYRSAEGDLARYPAIAAELVRLKPDVIVSGGGAPATRAAHGATRTIPIVFPVATDPVAEGWIKTLARPGGNLTGLSILESEMNPKRLQLLKEIAPSVLRVAVLIHANVPLTDTLVRAMERAAAGLEVKLQFFKVDRLEELEPAIRSARQAHAEALIVSASSLFAAHRVRLIALAAEQNLLAVWEHRQFTQAGGLVSYGADIADMYRSAARYVDRILKGHRPGDLPVEQANKLELVINLRTAKAMGIVIPARLLVRADQVIE